MHESRDMAKEVTEWARENENVRAVILTSTRANPNATVDALSDYDIVLYVKDCQPFLDEDEWMKAFGEVMVRHPVWNMVIYKDGSRIDFTIELVEALEDEINAPTLSEGYDIGYAVLLDKDGIAQGLKPPTYTAYRTKPPSESEYNELIRRFWFNITYVAKGLFRDQLFYAKEALDGHLHHHYLKTALSWYIGIRDDWKSNPGVFGKFFKEQLDPTTWADVEATFAGPDPEDNWDAMFRLAELFGKLTSEVGEHLGYTYPIEVDRDITAYLSKIRGMERKPY